MLIHCSENHYDAVCKAASQDRRPDGDLGFILRWRNELKNYESIKDSWPHDFVQWQFEVRAKFKDLDTCRKCMEYRSPNEDAGARIVRHEVMDLFGRFCRKINQIYTAAYEEVDFKQPECNQDRAYKSEV